MKIKEHIVNAYEWFIGWFNELNPLRKKPMLLSGCCVFYRPNLKLIFALHLLSKMARRHGKLVLYDGNFWNTQFPTSLYNPEKLAKVDYRYPGLACTVVEEGQVRKILADGTHRAAKAKADGKPFYVFLLNQKHSMKCISRRNEVVGNRRLVQQIRRPR